jgi:integrase
VVLAALHTGMRRGELLAVRWRRVDLVRREIAIEAATEKAGRGRVIPMTQALHARLVELRSEHARALDGTDPVFVLADARPVTSKILRSGFASAVRRCDGIPLEKRDRVTFHCLRHTAASLMVAEGVPLFDVAKTLGHSSIGVTMRYAHFAPKAARAGIDKLGNALRGASPPGEGHGAGAAGETVAPYSAKRTA